MKLPKLPPPTLVEDAPGLEELLDDLHDQREIAVDTEADSFFSYREKVCLIQVTVEDRDYLVDPLSGIDLEPFGEVLADPERTKVFHDGEYDVLILKRDYGFEFAGLFDTRVAAAALGVQNPGLASVLRDHFEVELDKSMQRSDWSQRPLSEKQIAYARLDTRFLVELMREQREQLEDRDRLVVVEGECRRLEALVPPDVGFEPDEFVRIKGARSLDPMQRRVLRELYALCDRMAAERNVPPFRVMNREAMLTLAQAQPKNRQALGRVRGFTPKQIRRMGDAVLETITEAREMEPIQKLPVLAPKDGTAGFRDTDHELHDRLKSWRKVVAQREDMDSSLILNRHVLLKLVTEMPEDLEALREVDGLQSWQADRYGKDILEVLHRFRTDLAAGRIELGRRRRR